MKELTDFGAGIGAAVRPWLGGNERPCLILFPLLT